MGAGCLGLPFLRSFGLVDIDLKTMEATVHSPKTPLLPVRTRWMCMGSKGLHSVPRG